MNDWMFTWNFTTKTCEPGEIWATCFLRLAYGSAEYDCSTLGSLNCSAPRLGGPVTDAHVFYGAFNIYGKHHPASTYRQMIYIYTNPLFFPLLAVNTYLTTWSNALYALKSQIAISQLANALGADGVGGLPPLTSSSLLSAIISQYGLDSAADEALVSILPSGSRATKLDTNVTYYSTQLSTLLGEVLEGLSGDFWNAWFLLLANHGQMMAYEGESLQNLEAGLAGLEVERVEQLDEEDPE